MPSWCRGLELPLASAALPCMIPEPGTDCLQHFDRQNLRCIRWSASSRLICSSTKISAGCSCVVRHRPVQRCCDCSNEFGADYKYPDLTELNWSVIMVAHSNGHTIIFCSCGFFFFLLSSSFFFFFAYFQRSEIGCLPYCHIWCGLSANLKCMSEMCCTRLAENTGRKITEKLPSAHYRTTLSGYRN